MHGPLHVKINFKSQLSVSRLKMNVPQRGHILKRRPKLGLYSLNWCPSIWSSSSSGGGGGGCSSSSSSSSSSTEEGIGCAFHSRRMFIRIFDELRNPGKNMRFS
jgi:hypothetical protein